MVTSQYHYENTRHECSFKPIHAYAMMEPAVGVGKQFLENSPHETSFRFVSSTWVRQTEETSRENRIPLQAYFLKASCVFDASKRAASDVN